MAGTHTVAFMEGRRGRIIGKDVHQEGGAPGTTPAAAAAAVVFDTTTEGKGYS